GRAPPPARRARLQGRGTAHVRRHAVRQCAAGGTVESVAPVRPIPLPACTMTSCLGSGIDATRRALREGASALAKLAFETVELDTYVGEIRGVDEARLPASLARFDCRNTRAAEMGLAHDGFEAAVQAAVKRHGAERVGVFIGTSTAG